MPVVTDYTSLLSGSSLHGTSHTGAFYTFSFSVAVPDYYDGAFPEAGLATFRPFTEAEKAVARAALQAFADASGLTFFEVPPGEGDMRFGSYNLDLMGQGGVAGVGYYPTGQFENQFSSDVIIDLDQAGSMPLVLHEIGHALGLKHPHEGEITLDPALDNHASTVMSYLGPASDVLGPLDLQAIDYLYGNNAADGTQVQSWSWNAATYTLSQTGFGTADTILGVGSADIILGLGGDDFVQARGGNDRVEGGDGADELYGGTGDDTVLGGAQNDTLYGEGGDDNLDGGAGDDTLMGSLGRDSFSGGDGDDKLYEDFDGTHPFLQANGGSGRDFLGISIQYNLIAPEFSLAGELAAGSTMIDIESVAIWGNDNGSRITGSSLSDYIEGGVGADVLSGGDGGDNVVGRAGMDELRGGAGGDSLSGWEDADILVGGGGSDVLNGGAGADLFVFLVASDSSASSPDWIEDFESGIDKIDLIALGATGVSWVASGSYQLVTVALTASTMQLFVKGSLALSDFRLVPEQFNGTTGDDQLKGTRSADILSGGGGNDRYFVDQVGDRVVETAGEGNDRVFASVSYTLGAGVSVELLTTDFNPGTAAINLTGNELVNTIFGNAGANLLDGRAGADTLVGFGGNDLYYVDNISDRIVEAASEGSADRVFASVNYTLAAGVHIETLSTAANAGATAINLTGNELVNTILGNAGANILDGRGGADTLAGLGGDDFYFIDNGADRILEGTGEGNDRVFASVSYVLGAGVWVEMLTTSNNAGIAAINLTGNDLVNTLYGNAGANMLDGKAGADVLAGLQGDDIYHVDNAGDRIGEAAGQGSDRVIASASFILGAGQSVEIMTTISSSATTAINLTGNALVQSIAGNAGANMLDSGGGGDTMLGFGGDDFYYVRAAGDRAVEAAGAGNDRVFAAVSFTLEAGSSIEVLSTAANAGTTAINLNGNELANTVIGNSGANILDGKSGADTLFGGAGADAFAFTTAPGAGNADRIVDFVPGTDKIRLDDAVFGGIVTSGNAFNAAAFVTGSGAADAGDRIIYNAATGQLFYDADGTGAGAAIQLATLQGAPVIGAGDFVVI